MIECYSALKSNIFFCKLLCRKKQNNLKTVPIPAGRLLKLLANIRLGRKRKIAMDDPAYFSSSSATEKKIEKNST